MPINNLRELIALLDNEGQLLRVTIPVSPDLEITEICDRVMKSHGGGKAILFENVLGAEFPVLANVFGSRERLSLIFGTDRLSDLTEELVEWLEQKSPMSVFDKLKLLPKAKRLHDTLPVEVSRSQAPCMDIIIDTPSFDLLPVCKCWPGDGGRYITFPQVFSKDMRTGIRNCGMYRLQIFDERTCGMHWHLHKGGAEHLRGAGLAHDVLPVSIALGGGPVEQFCAAFPLPQDVDEMLFAGMLKHAPVRLVKCRTNDLLVPADADFILEGYVDPQELRQEGPFGDHTGFYSAVNDYPVFHLTAMSRRENAVYPHTIVGVPPMEDAYIGEAIEQLALPVLRKQFSEIENLHVPPAGCFHNFVIVSIHKSYPGHARKIMHSLWGTGQLMFSKCILVVDHDIDIRDYNKVLWQSGNCVDWARDIEVVKGPVDDLDHASLLPRFGGKIGVDATRKDHSEGHNRPWPDEVVMCESVKKKIDEIWGEIINP